MLHRLLDLMSRTRWASSTSEAATNAAIGPRPDDRSQRPAPRPAARPAARGGRRSRMVAALLLAGGTLCIGVASVEAQDEPVLPEVPVAPPEVQPIAECVIVNGDGSFTAFFGYANDTGEPLAIPKSYGNRTDEPSGRPPTSYSAGRVVAAFSVTSWEDVITWYLGDRQAVATPESTPCSTNPTVSEAPLALLLMLAPAGLTAWWLHRRRDRRPYSPC